MDATVGDETARIQVGVALPPDAEAIFISTDSRGTPGKLNREVLSRLGLGVDTIPDHLALAQGYAIVTKANRRLCFVVTVSDSPTDETLERGLRGALTDRRLAKTRSLWIPLMGTGAGGLAAPESERIIRRVLEETGWASRRDALIRISRPPKEGPPERAQFDLAAQQLLVVASELRRGTQKPSRLISTRLLLFALSLATHPLAPPLLAGNRDARDFAEAIQRRAGEKYGQLWREYFRPGFEFERISDDEIAGPTPNLAAVIQSARTRANARQSGQMEIQDLIAALLGATQGRQADAFRYLGIVPGELLQDVSDSRFGRVSLTLHNDVATTRDRLGYELYARAIAGFITHSQTPPPLSVSIQAPWGVGKSSLMRMIQERLDPRAERRSSSSPGTGRLRLRDVLKFLDGNRTTIEPAPLAPGRRWTVWFNAWKYDTTEQVWAGLVDAIVSQVSGRLSPGERELFLLRLQMARIDDNVIRKRIYDRIITIWWAHARKWTLGLGALVISLVGLGVAEKAAVVPKIPPDLQLQAANFLLSGGVAAQVLLAVYLVISYLGNRAKTRAEPASYSLADFLKVPDYDRAIGSIHQIHADLQRVLAVLPRQAFGRSSLVIFIDDLDRCAPSSVASLVEGVSSFLASELMCVFVIGMDPQMVAAALENAHQSVRQRLPKYERTVPLGWRFMDKFVQLPFTIPPSNAADFEGFLEDLGRPQDDADPDDYADLTEVAPIVRDLKWIGAQLKKYLARLPRVPGRPLTFRSESATESEQHQAGPGQGESPETSVEQPISFEESREVGLILNAVKADTAGNPRELKRLANLARFYLQLRNERRRTDPTWHAPPTESYARWIVLTARWPDMMRWLLWGADEAGWNQVESEQALAVRRLHIMESKTQPGDQGAWSKAVAERLSVAQGEETPWLNDPKLWEFFVREGRRNSPDRLSAAAAREFW